jgi:two-component system OmpR family response regulator
VDGLENDSWRVLLVEDDEDTETLVLRALRLAGAEDVFVARNGQEALSAIESTGKKPSLILLDAKLPGLDGFEVLERIRSGGSAKDAPVVLFSSEDAPAAQLRARSLGADEYAVKPVQYTELMDVVAAIVSRWLPRPTAAAV